jgi:hypothetical protein
MSQRVPGRNSITSFKVLTHANLFAVRIMQVVRIYFLGHLRRNLFANDLGQDFAIQIARYILPNRLIQMRTRQVDVIRFFLSQSRLIAHIVTTSGSKNTRALYLRDTDLSRMI